MNRKFLVSITGDNDNHYKEKIEEIKIRNISEVALFLERFLLKQREDIYNKLEKSSIKEIPLVHIRDDMSREEIELLYNRYNSRHFTIHENHFDVLNKWKGFEKNLFLEMNTDDVVANNVKVEKIGGFCVDIAHYQKQKDRETIDYEYIYNRRDDKNLFKCNHLSGYSFEEMQDLHYVKNESDFEYLKKIPKFVFGEVIAMEIDNTIKEQLKFKESIVKLLEEKEIF